MRTQPELVGHGVLASSVNKVWLRKLNEITGVILKKQIASKGFHPFQLLLQMHGANYQQGVAASAKQVPRVPLHNPPVFLSKGLKVRALSNFCLQFTLPSPIIRGTW